ncbi:hypothetical protein I553_4235 [Mycobacterium xenopi 4042]|uniref:Uncharacterized protein n=1 Tax=Mycobacterium xenopi 4042 TaxID=1299334 RepID=X8AGJ3_MYCXE|nr:hypothetical protein I553_4235 [Mycobacterium xenopi 4042]
MGSRDYTDAVNSALDRLRATGFYLDHFFANHGRWPPRRWPSSGSARRSTAGSRTTSSTATIPAADADGADH